MFIYEATISRDDEGFYACFEAFDANCVDGDTLEEVIESAAVALQLLIAERLETGLNLPKQDFKLSGSNVMRIAVAVEVSNEFLLRSKCLSVSEAARELGVTRGRVTQLLDADILQAVPFGKDRLVTIASVNERKANPGKHGRPPKPKYEAIYWGRLEEGVLIEAVDASQFEVFELVRFPSEIKQARAKAVKSENRVKTTSREEYQYCMVALDGEEHDGAVSFFSENPILYVRMQNANQLGRASTRHMEGRIEFEDVRLCEKTWYDKAAAIRELAAF